jgi:predicted TIM-barrel fold metal-dependent hydrolase
METRRNVLTWGAGAAGTALLGGCATTCPPSAMPGTLSEFAAASLIDGHCHLFNRKDLSAVRFFSWVVLEQYPAVTKIEALAAMAPEEPTLLDHIITVLLAIVGGDLAPEARQEAALLRSKRLKIAGAVSGVENEDEILDETERNVVRFLRDELVFDADPAIPPDIRRKAEDELVKMIYRAGARTDGPTTSSVADIRKARAQHARWARNLVRPPAEPAPADRALAADFDFPAVFHFIGLFRRHRHCLVEKLTDIHRQQKDDAGQAYNPQLLVPAMVDYGCWLRDDPSEGSTFAHQVEVWAEIARRDGGPAVHGYVAYDPLRQVLIEANRLPSGRTCRDEPLLLAKTALQEKGFLGVKLYPPMGFQPSGNAMRDFRYPERVLRDRFKDEPGDAAKLGQELDGALDRLYDYCWEHRIPIMAHGGNSIGANECYGLMADPTYWLPVFKRAKPPPVMLAHYGGFDQRARPYRIPDKCDAEIELPFEQTWEAVVCRHVEQFDRPGAPCPVYVDISMLTEVFRAADAARIAERFKEMFGRYPMMRDHVVFGTDWSMLALMNGAPHFTHDVHAFLGSVWGKSPPDVRAVMRDNFLRFAGLGLGQPGRDRIAKVYAEVSDDLRRRLETRLTGALA